MDTVQNSAGDYGYGPSDQFINDQASIGQRAYEKQRFGRPQFGFPDISQQGVENDRLLNVLLGASAGAQAGSAGVNPLAALAMGIGGGISAPRAQDFRAKRQAAQDELLTNQYKLREKELDLTPIDQVSPAIVQEHPQLSGFTLGNINKITPLLQSDAKIKATREQFNLNEQLKRDLANASPIMQAWAASAMGVPIEFVRGLKTNELGALKEQQNKPLTAEMEKLKINTGDGITAITRALEIYQKSPQAVKILGAYKGFGADVLRVASPDAQEFARSVDKATDVVTRMRTGAALNAKEQEFYTGIVTKVLQSNGQNVKAMQELLKFYEDFQRDIESGRRVSGIGAIGRDPKKLEALARKLNINLESIKGIDFSVPAEVQGATPMAPQQDASALIKDLASRGFNRDQIKEELKKRGF